MDTPGQPPPSPDAPGDAGLRLTWLPMAEAVRRLAVSERTIRRRLASREYNARRAGKVTLVGVPAGELAMAGDAAARPAPSGDGTGAAGDIRQVPENARNGTQEALEGASLTETVLRLAQAVEAATEKDRLLAAMLERIGNLETELARLREREALPAPTEPSQAAPKPPWWRRVLGRR